MYVIRKWKFKDNTVTEEKDGSLSCDCTEFALFGYCDHIRYIEEKYISKERVIEVPLL